MVVAFMLVASMTPMAIYGGFVTGEVTESLDLPIVETQTISPAALPFISDYIPIMPLVNVTTEQQLRNAITGVPGIGGTATVIGDITITSWVLFSSNTTLIIPLGSTLTINGGVFFDAVSGNITITNNGEIVNNGTFTWGSGAGTFINNATFTNNGTLDNGAGIINNGNINNNGNIMGFGTITGNVVMHEITYSVTGIGGTVSMSHTSPIAQGTNVTFTATPNSGFQVKEWTDNSSVVTGHTANTYTINNIAQTHTITVEFEPISLTPPIITTYNAVPGRVGDSYGFIFVATGNPAPAFSYIGTLPPGLTLASTTGVLSGTPTTAGTFDFTIVATNFVGTDAAIGITITIDELIHA